MQLIKLFLDLHILVDRNYMSYQRRLVSIIFLGWISTSAGMTINAKPSLKPELPPTKSHSMNKRHNHQAVWRFDLFQSAPIHQTHNLR